MTKHIITIMKNLFSIACFFAGSLLQAQNVTRLEYWIDEDPGFGSGTAITLPEGADVSEFNFSIPSGMSTGMHVFGLRSQDEANIWSQTNMMQFYVRDTVTSLITAVEYFWDADSGYYNCPVLVLAEPIADLDEGLIDLPVSPDLEGGAHTLFMRSYNSQHQWSHTNYVLNVSIDVMELSDIPGLMAYPNPTTDILTLNATDQSVKGLRVYDANGKCILHTTIKGQMTLDASAWSCGNYTIFIWGADNHVHKSTIIKN